MTEKRVWLVKPDTNKIDYKEIERLPEEILVVEPKERFIRPKTALSKCYAMSGRQQSNTFEININKRLTSAETVI